MTRTLVALVSTAVRSMTCGLTFVALTSPAAGLATAAELSGTIQALDEEHRTYVLEDGTRLSVGPDQIFLRFDPGTKITVEYEEQDGRAVIKEFKRFGDPPQPLVPKAPAGSSRPRR